MIFSFSNANATENEEHEDIELSAQAIENYNLKFEIINQNEPFTLKKTAIINAQDKYFIYKKDGHGFEQIQIEPIKIDENSISFSSSEIQKGDEIVVSGSRYLRVIFLDMESGEVGHAH